MTKNDFKINDFVSVYTDIEEESFGLGTVIALDDEDIVIESVDPAGIDDGLIMYNISTVCKVEVNTQYCLKIKKLMEAKKTRQGKYKLAGKSVLRELLSLAKDSKKLVDIQLQNSHKTNVFGFIEFFDENTCEVKQVDDYGKEDGICIFSTEEISAIKYDSQESKDILLLFTGN